jgi:hypothetical protein
MILGANLVASGECEYLRNSYKLHIIHVKKKFTSIKNWYLGKFVDNGAMTYFGSGDQVLAYLRVRMGYGSVAALRVSFVSQ